METWPSWERRRWEHFFLCSIQSEVEEEEEEDDKETKGLSDVKREERMRRMKSRWDRQRVTCSEETGRDVEETGAGLQCHLMMDTLHSGRLVMGAEELMERESELRGSGRGRAGAARHLELRSDHTHWWYQLSSSSWHHRTDWRNLSWVMVEKLKVEGLQSGWNSTLLICYLLSNELRCNDL